MTPKRHRLRRIMKWTGLGMCVLIAVLWAVSLRYTVSYDATNYNGRIGIARGCGALVIAKDPGIPVGWFVRPRLMPTLWLPIIDFRGDIAIGIPLWIPFLLVAVATGYLFLHDRRLIAPGHCQSCNYNLTGNLSGICPECGTLVRQRP